MATIDELNEVNERAQAVASAAPTLWIPWLETRQPTGGCSFIQFGRSDRDDEIYVELIFDNKPATSPDPRLDVLVDFVASGELGSDGRNHLDGEEAEHEHRWFGHV